jgi:hypothetical protein
MNPLPQLPSFVSGLRLKSVMRPRLTRTLTVALLACAASIPPLHAQNAALVSPKVQKAPEALPAAPSASAANPGVAVSAFASYRRQAQFTTLPGSSLDLEKRSFITPFQSPFQPTANFGALGAWDSAVRFDGTSSFGSARHATIGFNQFSSFTMGDRESHSATMILPSSMTGGPFGAAPQPNLSQLMRGTFNMPLSSSSTSRFQYSNMLAPGGNLNDFTHPYGSALFTTSDLGNGVFLSAGTYNGGHSMAGAPTTPSGNGTGAPKHPGSGVAIKLSF